MYEIVYYQNQKGTKPVKQFIDTLDIKIKAKTFGILKLLEGYGPELTMPYSRYLEAQIYELRIKQGTNTIRIFYFFVTDKKIILTHGFIKKSQKTPKYQIDRAKQLRADWKKRYE